MRVLHSFEGLLLRWHEKSFLLLNLHLFSLQDPLLMCLAAANVLLQAARPHDLCALTALESKRALALVEIRLANVSLALLP